MSPEQGYEIEVYEDKVGEWRWRLVASNGNVVADSSEGYVAKDAAEVMAERIFEGSTRVRIREA